eukprot:gene18980-24792_t
MRQPYKTKRKSEIRGSNKKPHPQKGQGRAQAGHKRNAIWRGGHKAHGPVIRDFSIGMTRKQRAMAMMIAIAAKYLEGNLIIVDAMTVKSPKTREVAGALKSLDEFTPDFLTASRNIKNIETVTQQALHVYEVVRKDKLVITVKGLEALQGRLMAQYNHTGNNDILNGVDWTILPYERWAIVGRNGEGKSTLLKAITSTGGEILSIREGTIEINKKARLGYLEQKGVSGSTKTVREEVSSRMERLVLATKNLERLEQLVSEGRVDDEVLTQLSEAQGEFEAAGGYNVEQKISLVLKGLGFVENDYDKLCSEFSGGWQMRIALARLLLSEPDLLLLDEPTNHLDKGARDWLATYLSKYDGTLLLVSHDENLLRLAANSIAEVSE